LDTDALNLSLLNHCFLCTPFDTELPANHQSLNDHKPIIFQANEVLRKVFVFSDVLEFPVHLRYHPPTNEQSGKLFKSILTYGFSGLSEEIVIEPPRVYLRCDKNETLMEDESCRDHVEKVS
jgi:hypothetical protein